MNKRYLFECGCINKNHETSPIGLRGCPVAVCPQHPSKRIKNFIIDCESCGDEAILSKSAKNVKCCPGCVGRKVRERAKDSSNDRHLNSIDEFLPAKPVAPMNPLEELKANLSALLIALPSIMEEGKDIVINQKLSVKVSNPIKQRINNGEININFNPQVAVNIVNIGSITNLINESIDLIDRANQDVQIINTGVKPTQIRVDHRKFRELVNEFKGLIVSRVYERNGNNASATGRELGINYKTVLDNIKSDGAVG